MVQWPRAPLPAKPGGTIITHEPRALLRRLLAGSPVALVLLPPFGLLAGSVDVLTIVLTLALLVISLGVHEAAHAWTAYRLGDPTGKDLGRMTLNPIVHIDLVWTILVPVLAIITTGFVFGGAKPVPVSFHRLRHPWRDMALVAFAGPFSNLLLATLFLVLWKFFVSTGYYNGAAPAAYLRQSDLLPRVLDAAIDFNILLLVFNLVPVPPLDGSRIMSWALPESLREPYNALSRYGLLVVFLLMMMSPQASYFIRMLMARVGHMLETVVSLGGRW